MTAAYLARLTATLSRFRLSRNEIPRGTSSIEDAVIETNTTGACLPWNLSTVPTCTSVQAGRVESAAQQHDLRVVRRDDQHVVAGQRPGAVLVGPRRRRAARSISATIASASSGLSVELPSWSTASTRTPGATAVESPGAR